MPSFKGLLAPWPGRPQPPAGRAALHPQKNRAKAKPSRAVNPSVTACLFGTYPQFHTRASCFLGSTPASCGNVDKCQGFSEVIQQFESCFYLGSLIKKLDLFKNKQWIFEKPKQTDHQIFLQIQALHLKKFLTVILFFYSL